jgi:hypothetical protein
VYEEEQAALAACSVVSGKQIGQLAGLWFDCRRVSRAACLEFL